MPKITFIGAGSTVFAKNLMGDILSYPALADSTLCLFDIDEERLRTFSHELTNALDLNTIGRVLPRLCRAVMAATGADAYAIPGQKWLLGPEGMGALAVTREGRERLGRDPGQMARGHPHLGRRLDLAPLVRLNNQTLAGGDAAPGSRCAAGGAGSG